MSHTAGCYDYTFRESCFGTLRREFEMPQYNGHCETHDEIAQHIHYYNFDCRHSGIEYIKPVQFEELINRP